MTKSLLHPGALWLFRLRAYLFILLLGAFVFVPVSIGIVAMILALFGDLFVVPLLITSLLFPIIIAALVGEMYARMAYVRWMYEFSEEGIHLERGIIWKRYNNIPYERVQNIDINRGIIARLCGFSTLMIHTAGYSAQPFAEGNIPAVDMNQAEQIRAALMKRISKARR